MNRIDLAQRYRDYIACLNQQDWASLPRFVADDVEHNGRALGVSGYQAMLEKDFEMIPDLRFNIGLLVVDPTADLFDKPAGGPSDKSSANAPCVACRLEFHCHPKGLFLDVPVNGRRVSFAENVFYAFRDGKIAHVWSVIDKAEIEAQL